MKITHCQTNHITNPLSFDLDVPVLTWQVEDAKGKKQTAARIVVSTHSDLSAPMLDTGFADLSSLGYAVKAALAPRTRYYWTVTVRTDAGEEAASETQWFETAKLDEAWQAQWITCPKTNRHPYFKKLIEIAEKPVSARLYICGLGVYEASIDGEKVGSEYLTPYCNNYDEWLQYQTFDVTAQLQRSATLRVMLGSGWGIGRFGYYSCPGDTSPYDKPFALIAELHLTYADGREEVIITDESWLVGRSTITESCIYDGETRDDTLPAKEPEKATVCEIKTPLVARYSLPVTAHEELQADGILHTPAGEFVLDMKQNVTGIFRLHVHAPRGTKIHLQFGEVLQGGNFYNENLRTAKAEYWYTTDGTDHVLEPKFTYYGYRYVKIEGIPDLKASDFTAVCLYSDLESTGSLRTGHAKVNRLIENAEWGLRDNFLDVPTDCPQRDERMGWTGDAQVFSATASYLRNSYAFYRKYLHDMATEQPKWGGMVPNVVPSFHYKECASVWGDASCIIPWNLYLFTGDSTILREQFASMKAWVDYIKGVDGDDHGWERVFHFGDWLALDHPAGGTDQCYGGTDEGYIAEIYYAQSARIVAESAKLLGYTADAETYGALADTVTDYIKREYFSPAGRCCINTQTGLVLALKHHLSASPEVVKAQLVKRFAQTRGMLQTGFVGSPLLCNVLSDNGMNKTAYDLLLNESYPGWLYEVNLGATTIWERWNSLSPDGTVSSTGMNSFNHYSYGSIVEWLYRHAAGLESVTPGFGEVNIHPVPDARIGHLDMTCRTASGVYEVHWNAVSLNRLQLRIAVPFGCTAHVTLPYAPDTAYTADNPLTAHAEDGVCTVGAGCYEIEYDTTRPLKKVYTVDDPLNVLMENEGTFKVMEKYLPGIGGLPADLKKSPLRELLNFPTVRAEGMIPTLNAEFAKY